MDPFKFNKLNLNEFTNDYPAPDIISNLIDKIIEDYNKDISEAVATLDINNLKAVVDKYNKKGFYYDCFSLPSDEVLEITIRKMAIHILSIPDEVKDEAKEWLLSRGYDLNLE